MKIFNLSLSRCGTTSFHYAMEILGYKSIHALHGGSTEHNRYINRLMEGLFDWQVLKEYDAFSDLPIPIYYKQLHNIFPNAKFVLQTRSIDDWLDSCEYWFNCMGYHFKNYHICNTNESQNIIEINTPAFIRTLVYGIPSFNREIFSDFYKKHIEEVTEYFKYNVNFRMLDLEAENKWEPLCDFLDKKIPKAQYPKTNSRKST